MPIIYTLLLSALTPFIVLRLLWKSIKLPAYRARMNERFGVVPVLSKHEAGKRLWIHAVSVGEVNAASILINQLFVEINQIEIIVTTVTPTGAQRVKQLFSSKVQHLYMPYDLPNVIKRFIDRIKPNTILIMETEIWPNLYQIAHSYSIPIWLINARLSEKSYRLYAKFKWLFKVSVSKLSGIAAQEQVDVNRFIDLGADPSKISAVGNIKYDLTLDQSIINQGQEIKQTIGKERLSLMAVSTHPGEEKEILNVFKQLCLEINSNFLLILAPRHPERFNEVYNLCNELQLITQRKSEVSTIQLSTACFILDSLGETLPYMYAADVVLVGGSLVDIGGHNVVEPALFAKPIVSGPYVTNFATIVSKLKQRQGIEIVQDKDDLKQCLQELFTSPILREEIGDSAYQFIKANQGATQRILKKLDFLYS